MKGPDELGPQCQYCCVEVGVEGGREENIILKREKKKSETTFQISIYDTYRLVYPRARTCFGLETYKCRLGVTFGSRPRYLFDADEGFTAYLEDLATW